MNSFSPEAIAEAVATRRHLHANPELKYEERGTADLVASRLRGLGYTVETGVAETGVVGLLDTGRPGPDHRPPRRHGRPADPRGHRAALRLEDPRQDACLRP